MISYFFIFYIFPTAYIQTVLWNSVMGQVATITQTLDLQKTFRF